MLIASLWMAVMAFAVAIGAAVFPSTVEVIHAVLVALALMGSSSLAFWMAVELRADENEGPTGIPVPVPVPVRRRR